MRAVGMMLLAALLLAGCGGGEEPAETPAPKTIATAEPTHTGLMGALASVKAGEAAHSGEEAGRTWVRAAVRLNRPVGVFTNELVRHGLPQYFGE